MPFNRSHRALLASGIALGALCYPNQAHASRWQQWAQQGATLVKRGIQYRNQAAGGSEGYQHAPQQPSYEPPSASNGSPNSPGSNYYNIDPATMRNPNRHADPPPEQQQQQPAYTSPPAYTQRPAYRTGSDSGSENQQSTIKGYVSRKPIRGHAVARHVDKPERSSVVVVKPTDTSKLPIIDKPDVLKPATTIDTTWILPTVDRLEAKLRKRSS